MLLAVTTQTWIVTGLGFGMVVLLLFVFIYIMKGLGLIMNKLSQPAEQKATNPVPKKKVYATDADQATYAAIAMALALANGDEDKAAIAYALHLYYDHGHDSVLPQLTIRQHSTTWNSKMYGMNNLH